MASRVCKNLPKRIQSFRTETLYRLPLNWRRSSSSTRQWSTPLAKNIAEAIATTGPISIASYMRQCLTSPDGGYYTSHTPGKDQFGQKGDFITSPEISQIFGELLGIWLVAEWMAQGKISKGVEIIEVGPGRGTLMDDMLRTLSHFKPLTSSIEQIYLVEASPSLRNKQKQVLCGDAPMKETAIGFQSTSKYSKLPITWCEDIRFVPNDPSKTPFIFAHEFFDALPIHAFQSVTPSPSQILTSPTGPLPLSPNAQKRLTPQWRELLVTPTPPPPPPNNLPPSSSSSSSKPPPTPPDFQLSLSETPTPPSLLLPTKSKRYTALLPTPNATIEISPESQAYIADFARRIGGSPSSPITSPTKPNPTPNPTQPPHPPHPPSGAALILDYGPQSTIPTSTLRGIRAHRPTSPFSHPGLVDLSADVDFTALADAALDASPGVEVHGPVEQGAWLLAMGVRERAAAICKAMEEGGGGRGGNGVGGDKDGEGRKRVRKGVERLVERGGGGMGRVYKVLAVVPERGGRRPVGFGGVVEDEV